MKIYVVSGFHKRNNDFEILAAFTNKRDAEKYCEKAQRSEYFDDVRFHDPVIIDGLADYSKE